VNKLVQKEQGPTLPPLAIRAWLRYDVVSRLVQKLQPKKILEIGCGQGSMGTRLAAQHPYLGVEPDTESYKIAEARVTSVGGEVIHGTSDDAPAGHTYDLVCAFEVLEHIEDDQAALADWSKFVAPGGHLMLSVPAFQRMFGPMDRHAGHFRRYEPAGLTALLEGAGFTEVEIVVYAWPLGYALEAVRNRIDEKKLAAAGDKSISELTAASGRTFQPSTKPVGEAVRLATLPFRFLQRLRPTAGTGLVAVARKLA
jgi:SAM-dependent methyltransferase